MFDTRRDIQHDTSAYFKKEDKSTCPGTLYLSFSPKIAVKAVVPLNIPRLPAHLIYSSVSHVTSVSSVLLFPRLLNVFSLISPVSEVNLVRYALSPQCVQFNLSRFPNVSNPVSLVAPVYPVCVLFGQAGQS